MPTRDEILNGTPEQLRDWIAEAQGWKRLDDIWQNHHTTVCGKETGVGRYDAAWETQTGKRIHGLVWNPGHDIAAAWELVKEAGLMVSPTLCLPGGRQWIAGQFMGVTGDGKRYMVAATVAQSETAPIAICRAYLLARLEGEA